MATEATPPGIQTLPAPTQLSSYLADDDLNQILNWFLDFTTLTTFGLRKRVFVFANDPQYYEFTENGTGTYTVPLDEACGQFVTTAATPNLFFTPNANYFTIADEIYANTTGNSIETSIKIVTSDSVGARIHYTDDVYTETLIVLSDRIQLLNADVYYLMDTTDDYHKYTFTIKGTAIKVYVDSVLRITATASAAGGTKNIRFGHFASVGNMTSRWEYISYAEGACIPIDLENIDYEIQTDSVPSFDSSNSKFYTIPASSASLYNDSMAVGYSLTLPPRSIYAEYPFYWRVKHSGSTYTSSWSASSTFTREKNEREAIFKLIYDALPDDNVYDKDTYSGNVALLQRAQAREIAKVNYELSNILKDLSFEKTRPSYLYSNLGSFYRLASSAFNNFVEYRKFLRNVFIAFLSAGTQKSVEDTVFSLTGIYPTITEYFNKNDNWILTTAGNPRYVLLDSDYPILGTIISILSREGIAFTWQLHIPNPFNITYDRQMLFYIIRKLKPAHTQVNIYFYDSRGTQILDYDYYGLDDYGEASFNW